MVIRSLNKHLIGSPECFLVHRQINYSTMWMQIYLCFNLGLSLFFLLSFTKYLWIPFISNSPHRQVICQLYHPTKLIKPVFASNYYGRGMNFLAWHCLSGEVIVACFASSLQWFVSRFTIFLATTWKKKTQIPIQTRDNDRPRATSWIIETSFSLEPSLRWPLVHCFLVEL